jgi:predicted ATPase
MVFLSALRRRPDAAVDQDRFPWTLPLVRDLETLEFTTPVTFLVGENGSGKSTLLEGIAAGMEAVAAGAHDLKRDPTLQPARDLAAGFVFVGSSDLLRQADDPHAVKVFDPSVRGKTDQFILKFRKPKP